jgi:hypothetical protein|tara:strand:- start:626 stop:964 length:339 start_codon:yes stop_codon:yes gene_type:complete
MPTATVSKSPAPKARKTRTRKAPVKTTVQKVTPVKVEVKAVAKTTPIRTLKSVKRPSTGKLISPQRYWSDIQTRWAIHEYEITMLVSDLKKGFNLVTPYHTEIVKRVKAVNL